MADASSVEYWDMVCAMNSVSSVACIKAASVYWDRVLKAVKRDVEIWVNRYVRMTDSRGDCAAESERLPVVNRVDGIVVVISV